MRRKYIILIILLLVSAAISVIFFMNYEKKQNITNLTNTKVSYLYDFTTKTTFPKEDLAKFKLKLGELEKKQDKKIDDYREEAKMNDYLGFPGRGVLIYENYLSGALDFVYYNNLGNLYKQVCIAKKDITCDKALTNFYECVNKYSNLQNYKDIVEVLAKKGDVKKAKEEYEKYKSKGGNIDEYLESLIK